MEVTQFLPTHARRFEGDNVSPAGHEQVSILPRTQVYSQPPLRSEQSIGVDTAK